MIEKILKVIEVIVTAVEGYYMSDKEQTKREIEINLDDTTVVGVNPAATSGPPPAAGVSAPTGAPPSKKAPSGPPPSGPPPAKKNGQPPPALPEAPKYDRSRGSSTRELDAVIDQMHREDNNLFFVRLTERIVSENSRFGLKMDYKKDDKNFIYNKATEGSALKKVIDDNDITITKGEDKIVSFIHKQNEKIYKYSVKDETVTKLAEPGAIPEASKWEEIFKPQYNNSGFEDFFKTTFTTASTKSTVNDNHPLVIVFEKGTNSGLSGGGNLVEI